MGDRTGDGGVGRDAGDSRVPVRFGAARIAHGTVRRCRGGGRPSRAVGEFAELDGDHRPSHRSSMSVSYGFALSCAAVLGIVLFAGPLTDWLACMLPRLLSAPLAMTIAAQSLTLPIQVLMDPQLPLASVPANLLVGPVVGFATMAGLVALFISG